MLKRSDRSKVLLVLAPPVWPGLPPVGIASLAAFAVKRGIAVDLMDVNNRLYRSSERLLQKKWETGCNAGLAVALGQRFCDETDIFVRDLVERMAGYEAIGFSCLKSNMAATRGLVRIIKKVYPRTRILLGGPEMARCYFLTQGRFDDEVFAAADGIVVGEGERAFMDLILDTGAPKIRIFEEDEEWGSGVFPTYEGLDLSHYPKSRILPVVFSRGCIRRCRFCAERHLSRRLRFRPVGSVIEEIDYHRRARGIEEIVFHDSMLNADFGRLKELCQALCENFGSIPWQAQVAVRPDTPEDILRLMKKSGCIHLFIGLESGSAATLRRMRKGFTPSDALVFFEKLKSVGLSFGVSLIIGYPGETQQEFQESLDFVIAHRDLIAKIEQVNPYVYYEGTDVDGHLIDDGQSRERFEHFVAEIRRHKIKHTRAYIGNLVAEEAQPFS